MSQANEPKTETDALRDRLARLTRANLRVSESLDLTTVLQEIVENACALTDTRHGSITAMDESGEMDGFVLLGFTPEEQRCLLGFPGAWDLYQYLREHSGPVEFKDLAAHLRERGIAGELPEGFGHSHSLLAAQMRYRGKHVGNFFVSGKNGGLEFTADDEEVLTVFASQAAAAIANARRHRAERRAKADLEALVDTAPVGVVVLDARTGAVQSINREVKRILDGLGISGRSPERVLDRLNFRRADGREISPEDLPVTQALANASTVRAEEIVIATPDGRSVTTLVNATPIRAKDGETESMVVTVQDMTPLEELERMRAEFLGMVSHELRAPLAAVKGCSATLMRALSDLGQAETRQFIRIIDEQADHMQDLISDLLDVGRIEAGTLSVEPAPASVASLVDQARKTFLSGGGRNPLRIDLAPDLPPVMADRRRIAQVVVNLLSNASQHSPQSSPIRIDAVRDGVHVSISVTDQGGGVTAEALPHLFRKFFRAGESGQGRGIRGAGLGLAIAKGLVEAHGGRIWAESDGAGQGTRFTFTIPVEAEAGGHIAPQSDDRLERSRRERRSVLVVDDDPQMLHYIRHILEEAGFSVFVTGDPEEVSRLIAAHRPHLVLLDLMLPGRDGIQLMREIPAMRELVVILISGYGREETVIRALEDGAADYIVKPFSPTELVARAKAAMRGRVAPTDPIVLGELVIDRQQRRVRVAGSEVELTATEYDLLYELARNAGRVLSYKTLLRRVWVRRSGANIRLLRAFVMQLRRKIGDDSTDPRYIFTVRGVGYRMSPVG